MTTRRTLSIGVATLFVLGALTACFPTLPGGGGTPGGNTGGGTEGGSTDTVDISGNWTGTDSDGDSWDIEFQDDNTMAIVYNGDGPSDAAEDTWTLTGADLSFTVTGFENGSVTCDGTVSGTSAPLDCSYAGRPFTLTLTQG